jgi:hypothetical protein
MRLRTGQVYFRYQIKSVGQTIWAIIERICLGSADDVDGGTLTEDTPTAMKQRYSKNQYGE